MAVFSLQNEFLLLIREGYGDPVDARTVHIENFERNPVELALLANPGHPSQVAQEIPGNGCVAGSFALDRFAVEVLVEFVNGRFSGDVIPPVGGLDDVRLVFVVFVRQIPDDRFD